MRWPLLTLVLVAAVTPTWAADDLTASRSLRVLYVGDAESTRARAFGRFLENHFRLAAIAERDGFDPKRAADADVVLLDWPQDGTDIFRTLKPPLGARADWSKPTVLLGSAGLRTAVAWSVHGGFG